MTYAGYPVSGGGGSGDVQGPASSVDNGVVLFDGTSGKIIKDLGVGSANQVLKTDGTTPAFGLIVNANVDASAAIDLTKLAATTANRALETDGSGLIVASSVTTTELGYLSGVTSGIQGQIDGKLSLTGGTLTGDLTVQKATAGIIVDSTSSVGYISIGYSARDWQIQAAAAGLIFRDATGGTDHAILDTFGKLSLLATSNQLLFGTTNTTTISATAPGSSITLTIPDAGTDANFILSESAQTINGAKTFSNTITGDISGNAGTVTDGAYLSASQSFTGANTFTQTITGDISGNAGTVTNGAYVNVTNSFTSTQNILATTNQLVLGTTNTTTISATAPSSSLVYTMPDVGGNADFVMTAGAQTIGGAKTFSDNLNWQSSLLFGNTQSNAFSSASFQQIGSSHSQSYYFSGTGSIGALAHIGGGYFNGTSFYGGEDNMALGWMQVAGASSDAGTIFRVSRIDNGSYVNTAETTALSTSTELFTVKAGGNVSFGTVSNVRGRLNITNSTGTNRVFLNHEIDSVVSFGLGVDTSNNLTIGTTSGLDTWASKIITATSAGNVGIGTASPTAKLHVSEDSANAYINLTRTGTTPHRLLLGAENSGCKLYARTTGTTAGPMAFLSGTTQAIAYDTAGAVTLGPSGVLTDHTMNGRITTQATSSTLSYDGVTITNTTTSVSAYSGLRCTSNGGSAYFIKNSVQNTAGAADALRIINETGGVFMSPGATSFSSISDMRYKTKVSDLGQVLPGILGLSVFTYQTDESVSAVKAPIELGLSAQEMLNVAPEIVTGSEENRYGISYDRLSVVAIKAIQELASLRSSDANRIEELHSELQAAKKRKPNK